MKELFDHIPVSTQPNELTDAELFGDLVEPPKQYAKILPFPIASKAVFCSYENKGPSNEK